MGEKHGIRRTKTRTSVSYIFEKYEERLKRDLES